MSTPKESDRLAFIGQLAAGLAHEIRTPLSTLQANLQLLQEDFSEAKDDRERRALQRITLLLKETGRLEEILGDFLRFAAGHKLERRPTDLNRVVGEVLDFVGPEAQQKKVRVLKSFGDLPKVPLDANLFKQALINLVMNAMQAMPDGGELIVRTQKWRDFAQVDVIDTGTGMTADVASKCFDVYYSTKKTGTGLGLPTTRRIIHEHDGTLTVTSEVGKGSCFTMRLPGVGEVEEKQGETITL
ncbi:MAG: two-component sensor histidine kinase [Planctomycetes bacterium]|nr:two-component sensor histidine kinase [Planctomycetota bacterium]